MGGSAWRPTYCLKCKQSLSHGDTGPTEPATVTEGAITEHGRAHIVCPPPPRLVLNQTRKPEEGR